MADKEKVSDASSEDTSQSRPKREMHWFLTLWHLHLHIFALYAVFLVFTEAKISTIFFALAWGVLSWLGVVLGAHRLWAHRSFSAAAPLRLFLLLCQTASCTGSVHQWVLQHRVHHKHHGTDKDPFNHKRGFVYSHLVSRVVALPPDWEETASGVDMADIEAEPMLRYQRRLYWAAAPLLGAVVPVNWASEYLGEDFLTAALVVFALRYVVVTHLAWLVSSGLLFWGLRPDNNYSYDTNLVFVANLTMWPHYHYLVPWDYQCGEYGTYGGGVATALVRAWAALGWVTALRTVDTAGARAAVERAVAAGGGGKADVVRALEDEGRRYSQRIASEHLLHRPLLF